MIGPWILVTLAKDTNEDNKMMVHSYYIENNKDPSSLTGFWHGKAELPVTGHLNNNILDIAAIQLELEYQVKLMFYIYYQDGSEGKIKLYEHIADGTGSLLLKTTDNKLVLLPEINQIVAQGTPEAQDCPTGKFNENNICIDTCLSPQTTLCNTKNIYENYYSSTLSTQPVVTACSTGEIFRNNKCQTCTAGKVRGNICVTVCTDLYEELAGHCFINCPWGSKLKALGTITNNVDIYDIANNCENDPLESGTRASYNASPTYSYSYSYILYYIYYKRYYYLRSRL